QFASDEETLARPRQVRPAPGERFNRGNAALAQGARVLKLQLRFRWADEFASQGAQPADLAVFDEDRCSRERDAVDRSGLVGFHDDGSATGQPMIEVRPNDSEQIDSRRGKVPDTRAD